MDTHIRQQSKHPHDLVVGRVGETVYESSGYFVMRCPLISVSEPVATDLLGSSLGSHVDCSRELYEELRSKAAGATMRLMALPHVREAMVVAATELFNSLSRDEAALHAGKSDLLPALYKYAVRMCTRGTPFGLFAGCSLGTIAERTSVELVPSMACRKSVSVDVELIRQACEVARRYKLPSGFAVRTNGTAYVVGHDVRFVQRAALGDRAHYRLATTQLAPPIESVLRSAAGGATVAQLRAELIAADPSLTIDDCDTFLADMVKEQLLLGGIEYGLASRNPLQHLRNELATPVGDGALTSDLSQLMAAVDELGSDVGGPLQPYLQSFSRTSDGLTVDGIGLGEGCHVSRLCVDMWRPAVSLSLSTTVIKELFAGVRALCRLSMPRALDQEYADFLKAMSIRYGHTFVPIMEALDPDRGVGYGQLSHEAADPSELLRDLPFGTSPVDSSGRWTARDLLLMRRLSECWRAGEREWQVSDNDLADFDRIGGADLPDTFSLLAEMDCGAQDSSSSGSLHVVSVTGPSGLRLVGRFCHLDASLRGEVARSIEREEALDPDRVYAEILHAPVGRAANVVMRPALRTHEIPIFGTPSVPHDRVVPLSDLYVGAVGNELVLVSRRLSREVVPRLSTAHNFGMDGLAVYKFLCHHQSNGLAGGVRWSWGCFEGAAFLPRVRYRNCILSPARWTFPRSVFDEMLSLKGYEQFHAVRAWARRERLPRQFRLGQSDHWLHVDLSNPASIEMLIGEVRRHAGARIQEVVPGGDERPQVQVVVPFVRRDGRKPRSNSSANRAWRFAGEISSADWALPPGSKCFYAKVYCSERDSDPILMEHLVPLLRDLEQSGTLARWFFVRYSDPETHLRVRAFAAKNSNVREIADRFEEFFGVIRGQGLSRRMAIDTFEPEIDRYGGSSGYALAEEVFHADSNLVVSLLSDVEFASARERWRIALWSVDSLLGALQVANVNRIRILAFLYEGFVAHVGEAGVVRRAVRKKFHGDDIGALIGEMDAAVCRRDRKFDIVKDKWKCEVAAAGRRATQLLADGAMTISFEEWVGDVIHMHCNRLFCSSQNAHEVVVYELLRREYVARGARSVER